MPSMVLCWCPNILFKNVCIYTTFAGSRKKYRTLCNEIVYLTTCFEPRGYVMHVYGLILRIRLNIESGKFSVTNWI